MCDLTNPAFTDEDKAREVIEASRWPNGATCPHCGLSETVSKLGGKSMGPGWYHCRQCREKFTVRTGTLYERSHIPLHKWLLATHLLTSSKKGMSAHQLFRMMGFGSYKTAWFMAMRIREGMRAGGLAPMGGAGGIVEADETFIGKKEGSTKRRGHGHKNAVLSLVERGGQVRSFHVDGTSAADVMPIIRKNVARETAMMTDEGGHYSRLGSDFASHETVQHKADEYVRYESDRIISTNTVEGYFSVFKRGMKGVYQHCSEKHLHRYLSEFDFRYNNRTALGVEDGERAAKALKGIEGKRLTYRIPREATTV
ncbi:IS1595 family transposase [Methylocapsa sp. D3K7]|uniref:IS1595 family transposase n=1 Tax=Methylocapsa sp. D3K7 TaxID=3041435 RepID=UPI00244EC598|nr:IS1595 family transposase [Methylocapsa sp. D3K7]WGJ14081.1 IS1595 family transposase [Methylocapsa sp. D3K7]